VCLRTSSLLNFPTHHPPAPQGPEREIQTMLQLPFTESGNSPPEPVVARTEAALGRLTAPAALAVDSSGGALAVRLAPVAGDGGKAPNTRLLTHRLSEFSAEYWTHRANGEVLASSTTSAPPLLAHLRRRSGRPLKAGAGDNPGDNRPAPAAQLCANTTLRQPGAEAHVAPVLPPRLLDRAGAAAYLSISVDLLDRLSRQGRLRRRLLPPTRCIRYDIRDLDRFVDQT